MEGSVLIICYTKPQLARRKKVFRPPEVKHGIDGLSEIGKTILVKICADCSIRVSQSSHYEPAKTAPAGQLAMAMLYKHSYCTHRY